jgi:hypothetical protein
MNPVILKAIHRRQNLQHYTFCMWNQLFLVLSCMWSDSYWVCCTTRSHTHTGVLSHSIHQSSAIGSPSSGSPNCPCASSTATLYKLTNKLPATRLYCSLTACFKFELQLQLIYDRQSVGQSVLVSGAHLEPVTNFSFSLKFLLDTYGFVML